MNEDPKAQDTEQLKKLTRDLINYLDNALKNIPEMNYDYAWQNPKVWREVIENLTEIINGNNLVEVLLGLEKHFDFYSLECFSSHQIKDILKLVSTIVATSWKLTSSQGIVSLPGCLGSIHEDEACSLAQFTKSRISRINTPAGWVKISKHKLKTFISNPLPKFFSGEKLFRIIGKNNYPYGNWWMHDDPTKKSSWRADMAVLKKWNPGDMIVELTLKPNQILNVWEGAATSQSIPCHPCILVGGGNQVYVNRKYIRQHFSLIPKQKIWL
jgi:hypothetical protein